MQEARLRKLKETKSKIAQQVIINNNMSMLLYCTGTKRLADIHVYVGYSHCQPLEDVPVTMGSDDMGVRRD